jgi:hypothetical protein
VGIVVGFNRFGAVVAESRLPLSCRTRFRNFVQRSAQGRVAVLRLPRALSEEETRRLRQAARRRLGRLYDNGFNLRSRRQFCSRFVSEVLRESTGIAVGEVVTFREAGAQSRNRPDAVEGLVLRPHSLGENHHHARESVHTSFPRGRVRRRAPPIEVVAGGVPQDITLRGTIRRMALSTRTERAARTVNRFDRMEWAGAFGDLGTLIPFVVAYIAVVKVDPFGILFSFGLAMIVCGLYYRTPFPVQPMKAIGAIAATQTAQTATITPAIVYSASLATGVIWLVLGLTGAARHIASLVPRTVVVGIVLGLGLSFMLEGIQSMQGGWAIATAGLIGTLLLLTNKSIPAMFLLLLFGIACGVAENPEPLRSLLATRPAFRLPSFALTGITWHDLLIGTTLLALPQLPLTLGNAVIAIHEENNRLFPDRAVTENRIATSTGAMNLVGAAFGGVPMCHGAGGMAGHVAFGARTGGAPIILGALLLSLALFFSPSIHALFEVFARPVLGVILFLTGAQLALGSCDFSKNKGERFITLTTTAFAMWNVGLAFIVGVSLAYLERRGRLRL